MPDPKFAMGHKCSEFTPPVVNLGAHVAPLGMKFYTGDMFPAEYKNNILIAEHGSWNRHKYQGARIKRVIVGPDGKNAKQEIFASGWLEGDTGLSRPSRRHRARQGRLDPRRRRLGRCDLSHQLQQVGLGTIGGRGCLKKQPRPLRLDVMPGLTRASILLRRVSAKQIDAGQARQ